MAKNDYKRPDEAAMRRVLQLYNGRIEEVILRLAWMMGLSVVEMRELKWDQVSFEEGQIHLPDRSIPMDEEMKKCLQARYEKEIEIMGRAEYVVTTDYRRVRMHRVYVSKCGNEAMDTEDALKDIALKDLREDFVIRMLEKHDWAYVSRISGLTVHSLYSNYSQFMERKRTESPAPEKIDQDAVSRVLEAEGTSPEGLALWMFLKLGIYLKDAVTLTWDQVDMGAKVIRLPDRDVPMDDRMERMLREVQEQRSSDDDPHVLLTPKTRGPFDYIRFSRTVRQALINGGMDKTTVMGILYGSRQQKEDEAVLQMMNQTGSVNRNQVMEALGLSASRAWRILKHLVEQGKLVRIGVNYYKPETVIPPEQHWDIIRTHLEKEGGAYRQTFAELLGIEVRSCGTILCRLRDEGKLVQKGRKYYLADSETQGK